MIQFQEKHWTDEGRKGKKDRQTDPIHTSLLATAGGPISLCTFTAFEIPGHFSYTHHQQDHFLTFEFFFLTGIKNTSHFLYSHNILVPKPEIKIKVG